MRVYLDSSALVKLVQAEPESGALGQFLVHHRGDEVVTSALARVEVPRAVAAGGAAAIQHAWRVVRRVDQIALDRALLDRAATLAPGIGLRSLDAIHLAAALTVGPELRSIVTYDQRMATAAEALGLAVDAPM